MSALLLGLLAATTTATTTATTAKAAEPLFASTVLKNGCELIRVARGGAAWTSFRIALRLGSALDPPGKSGLARVAGLVLESELDVGSPASEEPRILARLGVELEVETGLSSTIISGGVADDRLDDAMREIFHRLVEPSTTEASIRTAIDRALSERQALAADDRLRAELELRRILFGTHPYARDPHGEVRELASIAGEDVRAALKKQLKSGAITIAVASALPLETLAERATAWTEALPPGKAPDAEARAEPKPPKGRRVIIVDKPSAGAAEIVFGHLGARAADLRFPALTAANAAIGGCASSRLTRSSAGERAVSWLGRRAEPGAFAIAVGADADKAARAIAAVLEELEKIQKSGLDPADLELGRRCAGGRAILELRDPAHQVAAAITARMLGLAVDAPRLFGPAILAVNDAELDAAVRTLVSADDLTIVVVASATPALQKELAGLRGVRDVSIVGFEAR